MHQFVFINFFSFQLQREGKGSRVILANEDVLQTFYNFCCLRACKLVDAAPWPSRSFQLP